MTKRQILPPKRPTPANLEIPKPLPGVDEYELHFLWAIARLFTHPPDFKYHDTPSQLALFSLHILEHLDGSSAKDGNPDGNPPPEVPSMHESASPNPAGPPPSCPWESPTPPAFPPRAAPRNRDSRTSVVPIPEPSIGPWPVPSRFPSRCAPIQPSRASPKRLGRIVIRPSRVPRNAPSPTSPRGT